MMDDANSRTRRRQVLLRCTALALLGLTVAAIRLTSGNRDPRLIGRWAFRLQSSFAPDQDYRCSFEADGRAKWFVYATEPNGVVMSGDSHWRVKDGELILEPFFTPEGDAFPTFIKRFVHLFKIATGQLESKRFEIVDVQSDTMQLRPIPGKFGVGRSGFVTEYHRLPD